MFHSFKSKKQLENYMRSIIEQDCSNKSYMSSNKKNQFEDWYMKIDPPMSTSVDIDYKNILVKSTTDVRNVKNRQSLHDDPTQKFFKNQPLPLRCKLVEKPFYENLNQKKADHIENIREDCFESFKKEKLQ